MMTACAASLGLLDGIVELDEKNLDGNPRFRRSGVSLYGSMRFVRYPQAHINTAESFNAILEKAKQGVFHFVSSRHLLR